MSQAVQLKPESPLLSINNIEVVYDDVIQVLRGVSIDVPQGEIVTLLGPNGAGKSTTLKAISGLLKTENGEVSRGDIHFMGERIDVIPAMMVKLTKILTWCLITSHALKNELGLPDIYLVGSSKCSL